MEGGREWREGGRGEERREERRRGEREERERESVCVVALFIHLQ